MWAAFAIEAVANLAFGICERRRGGYGRAMRYDLNDLETFLTVMELGTVTAAPATA